VCTTVTFLAGGLAGASVDAVLFPLDTIKTRLQARVTATKTGVGLVSKGRLYSGLGVNTVGSLLASGTFMTVYEASKERVVPVVIGKEWKESWLNYLLSACLADLVSCVVRVPFESIKQRQQTLAGQSNGVASVLSIVTNTGYRRLYTGFLSTVLRELPFDAIEFAIYEKLKAAHGRYNIGRVSASEFHGLPSMLVGATAGAVAAACTTPLDTIKTRLMTQSLTDPRYRGVVHAFRTICRDEGPKALFRGIVPRVIWVATGGAIFFGTYESFKHRLATFVQ